MAKASIKEINAIVIGEATKLKAKATKAELNKLQFETLDPNNYRTCIYGQMTGDCFSPRAKKLIVASCERVFTRVSRWNNEDNRMNDAVCGILNGSPKGLSRKSTDTTTTIDFWSPIEVFIAMPRNRENGNNKRLIDYLKGETTELKLK